MTALPDLLSAGALANMRIDGLPTTKRGVTKRIASEGWPVVYGDGAQAFIEVARLREDIRSAIAARFRADQPIEPDQKRRPRGRPSGTDFFARNPDMADAVTAWLATRILAPARVYELLAAEFKGRELPHIRNVQRFVARVESEKKIILAQIRHPDKAGSHYRLSLGRADGSVTYAHEVWELDTTPADLMLLEGRKCILAVKDRWSRRCRFLIAHSESAQSVRALLFRAITDWGVIPARIVVDNGSGYINQSVKTACELLGIEHHPCPKGSPELKPFVERLFRTFTLERARLLPGFVGHNVAEAQQLRAAARKATGKAEIVPVLSMAELQEIIDNWTLGTFEMRVHSGIGMSPFDKARSSPVPATAAPDPDILGRMLTAYVGDRIIGKRGLVWNKGRYWCPELAAHKDRTVHVRRNEDELGILHVFDPDLKFIGSAVNHERLGLSEREFARWASDQERIYESSKREELRRLKKTHSMEKAARKLLVDEAARAGKLIEIKPFTRPRRPSVSTDRAEGSVRPQSATLLLHPVARSRDEIAARIEASERLIAQAAAGAVLDPAQVDLARAFLAGPVARAHRAVAELFETPQERTGS